MIEFVLFLLFFFHTDLLFDLNKVVDIIVQISMGSKFSTSILHQSKILCVFVNFTYTHGRKQRMRAVKRISARIWFRC